jgi:hypothetical protein
MSDEEAAHVVELVQVAVEQESNRDAWPRSERITGTRSDSRVSGGSTGRQSIGSFALTAPDKLE